MDLTTQIVRADQVELAANFLQQGECVAFPTETVYGLGANALDEVAVHKIFKAKGRPADNPLIVHCYNSLQIASLVKPYSSRVQALMDRFWPGPLSLILPKTSRVPAVVSGGLDTVAVRVPNHPLALQLLQLATIPVAAPSANVSGKPSPTRAEHVWRDLAGKIAAVLDGGSTGWGLESTVIDCTCWPHRLLRPGGVTLEQLQAVTEVAVDPGVYSDIFEKPRSPGMKYQHYAPDARVELVVGDHIQSTVKQLIQEKSKIYKRIGVMAVSEHVHAYLNVSVLDMGSQHDMRAIASSIYHLLRTADELELEYVIVEGLPETEMGMAIMNRLRKAAAYRIIIS